MDFLTLAESFYLPFSKLLTYLPSRDISNLCLTHPRLLKLMTHHHARFITQRLMPLQKIFRRFFSKGRWYSQGGRSYSRALWHMRRKKLETNEQVCGLFIILARLPEDMLDIEHKRWKFSASRIYFKLVFSHPFNVQFWQNCPFFLDMSLKRCHYYFNGKREMTYQMDDCRRGMTCFHQAFLSKRFQVCIELMKCLPPAHLQKIFCEEHSFNICYMVKDLEDPDLDFFYTNYILKYVQKHNMK